MFYHNFKYTLKILFKNRVMIFWMYGFPIILGLFFFMAFSNIENSEKLSTIDIAVISDEEFYQDSFLKNALSELESDGEHKLFNIQYVNLEEAEALLNNSKITGYIYVEKKMPKLKIKSNGTSETVLKYALDEIISTKLLVLDLSNENLTEEIYHTATNMIHSTNNTNDISKGNLSYTVIEYYTLIAMATLYGAMFGVYVINWSLPNMSFKGRRVGISPFKKSSLISSGLLASYFVSLIGLFLLLFFIKFIIGISLGDSFLEVLLLILVGNLAGLSLGVAIGSLSKTNENNKIGIVISVTMLCSFLSGMMGITMKYIIDKNIPFLNIINPANMITDGFYALYYYGSTNRYYFNLGSLFLFSLVMFFISILALRRQKYDSI